MSFLDRALSLLSEKERDTFSQELVDKAKRYGISIEDIRKLDKVSQLERLINKKIKEKGMIINGSFMFGFDEDTPDIFNKTLDKLAIIHYNIFTLNKTRF